MGNCISGLLSSVFMDSIEERSLHLLNVSLYKRYVDDCLCLTINEEEARKILAIMNTQNEHIQFDLELPGEDGSLSLLDFSVRFQNGDPKFSFFKKNARKPIFMHYNSAVPLQVKVNCIRNELKRIEDRCSTSTDKEAHHEEFGEMLKKNSYPENMVKFCKDVRKVKKRKKAPIYDDFVYFKFPFVNDVIHRRVQAIFRKNGLPTRIYDKNYTLRNALSKRKLPPCKLNKCTLANKLCNIKMCVYEMKCNGCQETYIGSTVRQLHTRVMEHMNKENSSVFQHAKKCGKSFSTDVIGKSGDNTSLRFKEALLIQKRRPAINAKRESDELVSLTFG